MLRELHIENIAVIERADIEPGPGLNVLTGETGAGKSIVIDSLQAVLGSRVSRELARTGAPLAIGPTFGQPSKVELQHKSWRTPGILSRAGCHVSIVTDSPVTEQAHLRF